MSENVSPLDSFATASDMAPTQLKWLLIIILVALLLFAYTWAVTHGYKGLASGNRDIFDFLKYVLLGAALILIIVAFFVY